MVGSRDRGGSRPNNASPKREADRTAREGECFDVGLRLIVEFLLPPGTANHGVVVNFCNSYNRRAIPGRRVVPFIALRKFSEPAADNRTQQRLDMLANECALDIPQASPREQIVDSVVIVGSVRGVHTWRWA